MNTATRFLIAGALIAAVLACSRTVDALWLYAMPPDLGGMCVTHGDADTGYHVESDSAALRAVAPQTGGDRVSIEFTARGEAQPPIPLADGHIRHQVCAKLRAADGCNLAYVCWRLEPSPWIQVQSKVNPGKHDSTACGAGGYISAIPTWAVAVPSFADGRQHTLAATLTGTALEVKVDGAPVWSGDVDQAVLGFDGPVGIRTDNERITATLRGDVDCSSVVGGE